MVSKLVVPKSDDELVSSDDKANETVSDYCREADSIPLPAAGKE